MDCSVEKPRLGSASGYPHNLGFAVKKKPEVLKTCHVLRSPLQKWQIPTLSGD